MKGMSLDQFKEVTEFVQKHHKFAYYKTEEKIKESKEAGIVDGTALRYGFGIKYVRCDYDTRFGDVWGITLDQIRFATNHFTSLKPPPKGWKYDNLFDLTMAYLKGKFKPKEEFYLK